MRPARRQAGSKTRKHSQTITTMAANRSQAPTVIHDDPLLKLCHIMRPRRGLVSSVSSRSRPAHRHATAPTAAAATVFLWASKSLNIIAMAATNVPAPRPPRNR